MNMKTHFKLSLVSFAVNENLLKSDSHVPKNLLSFASMKTLIKPFFYVTKKLEQKCQYLNNKY